MSDCFLRSILKKNVKSSEIFDRYILDDVGLAGASHCRRTYDLNQGGNTCGLLRKALKQEKVTLWVNESLLASLSKAIGDGTRHYGPRSCDEDDT
ncbi:hypothetical protein TNCV_4171011 [Trichonephila clavipes]|nr:hypothetical protein TNCV_4171011 [Trichonephila clavipes]